MEITVVICTWNRADILNKTLSNLLNLAHSSDFEWELLVINNNSIDSTDEVINAYEGRLPLRRIFEPVPGLSNARNAAIRAATGEYIIWTDDDVLVDKDWLVAYARAFRMWPKAAVFGGPVLPWFEGEPSQWLIESLPIISNAFAIRDLGDKPFKLTNDGKKLPFGANFAVRTAEQRQHLFDSRLGLNGGQVLLGEETQVILAVLNDGLDGWWVPDAKVQHWIPQARQSIEYLKKYFYGAGVTEKKLYAESSKSESSKLNKWLLRQYVLNKLKYLLKKPFSPPSQWIGSLAESQKLKGRIWG